MFFFIQVWTTRQCWQSSLCWMARVGFLTQTAKVSLQHLPSSLWVCRTRSGTSWTLDLLVSFICTCHASNSENATMLLLKHRHQTLDLFQNCRLTTTTWPDCQRLVQFMLETLKETMKNLNPSTCRSDFSLTALIKVLRYIYLNTGPV